MASVVIGRASAADRPTDHTYGILYGQKAAFGISAPKGWVLDNQSGLGNGQHCVMYPKEDSWEDAKAIMYAKVAGPTMEDVKQFIEYAIDGLKKSRAGFTYKQIATGKTKEGYEWIINEYPPTESYLRVERVAYVQMPKGVAFIVFSAENADVSTQFATALDEVVASFAYKSEFIGYQSPKVGAKK